MADIQRYFIEFDNRIKLGRFKESATLREKRDAVLGKLRDRLPKMFEDQGQSAPSFEAFDQGSYAMGTGVKPLEGDFDIDEGIAFDIKKDDYPDPVQVKQWVRDALDGHTTLPIEIKRPCVTVVYQIGNEPVYHVDLPIYAHDGADNSALYLARGDLNSANAERIWEKSDPLGLCAVIDNRFANRDDAKQFRRCIRYLKRWRDFKFSPDGNVAPVGIGITIAAFQWFSPERSLVDPVANTYWYNDLVALRCLVEQMLGHFSPSYHDNELADRLSVALPVTPYDDPFRRMTNIQMANFKRKLAQLREVLSYAEQREVAPEEACERLQNVFGDEFPVPDKDETGKRKGVAILTSSTSA